MYSGPHTGSNTLVSVPELQMSVTLCFVSPDFKLHFFCDADKICVKWIFHQWPSLDQGGMNI